MQRDIIPDRSIVLDFLLDGATFRVRSTFRTCFINAASAVLSSSLRLIREGEASDD